MKQLILDLLGLGKEKEKRSEANKEVLNIKLIHSAMRGDLESVSALIKYGADVNATNYIGQTALMKAVGHGRVEVVKLLLKHGADVNATSAYHHTAISLALWRENVEIVKLLVEHDPGLLESSKGILEFKLSEAVRRGQLEVVKALLDAGVDVDTTDEYDQTELMLAVENKHEIG